MRAAIQKEWDAITSQDLDALITSMSTRVQAVLVAKGGHTRF